MKLHHPDVYGGNLSPRIKELSHRIFILIKDHYISLLAAEEDQVIQAPRSGAGFHERPSTQERIQSLHGYKTHQARRERRFSPHGLNEDSAGTLPSLEVESEPFVSEFSTGQDLAEASAADRKVKVEALATRSQEILRADVNPSKEAFNAGFALYRQGQIPEALSSIKRAFELEPNPLNTTYYAHLLFRSDPEQFRVAEQLLRGVITNENKVETRQALPDAHLFMANLLKARNQPEKALENYEIALKLNPGCVDAEREIRREKMRSKRISTNPGDIF